MRLFPAVIGCCSVVCSAVHAQQAADTAPTARPSHDSGVGLTFVPIQGLGPLAATKEVTVAQWQQFLSATGYKWAPDKLHFDQTDDHPVVNICQADAEAYCSWLTEKERAEGKLNARQEYRLPSNREWSAASGLTSATGDFKENVDQRLDDEKLFPWGVAWPPPANAANLASHEIDGYEDKFPYTAPVASFAATSDGLYDVGGNAWEWTVDPKHTDGRVGFVRGGSWIYFRPEFLKASYRYEVPAGLRAPSFGFRVFYEDKDLSAKLIADARRARITEVDKASSRLRPEDEVDNTKTDTAKNRFLGDRNKAASGNELELTTTLAAPQAGMAFSNSLGMRFVPTQDRNVLAGAFEVLVKEYEYYAKQTGSPWKRPAFNQTGGHCAVSMSFDDAVAFCDWLTARERDMGALSATQRYRLPTDQEWSRMVGLSENSGTPAQLDGGSTGVYPWGNQWPPALFSGNFDSDKIKGYRDRYAYTSMAGKGSPNALQIADLAGNASEWVDDFWEPGSSDRVVRGSSWLDSSPEILQSSARKHFPPSTKKPDIGFRCVLDLR